jgi:hypothetical protein
MVSQSGSSTTALHYSSNSTLDSSRMHPCVFRDIWGLTNWQTALQLEVSERTIVAYCVSSSSVSRRNPSIAIQKITFSKHQSFLNQGLFPKSLKAFVGEV